MCSFPRGAGRAAPAGGDLWSAGCPCWPLSGLLLLAPERPPASQHPWSCGHHAGVAARPPAPAQAAGAKGTGCSPPLPACSALRRCTLRARSGGGLGARPRRWVSALDGGAGTERGLDCSSVRGGNGPPRCQRLPATLSTAGSRRDAAFPCQGLGAAALGGTRSARAHGQEATAGWRGLQPPGFVWDLRERWSLSSQGRGRGPSRNSSAPWEGGGREGSWLPDPPGHWAHIQG